MQGLIGTIWKIGIGIHNIILWIHDSYSFMEKEL